MAALLDVVMCGSQARNFWAPLRPEIRFSRRMPPADFRPAPGLRSSRGQLFGKGIASNLILRTTRAGIGGRSDQWMNLCRHYRDRFGTRLMSAFCPPAGRDCGRTLRNLPADLEVPRSKALAGAHGPANRAGRAPGHPAIVRHQSAIRAVDEESDVEHSLVDGDARS